MLIYLSSCRYQRFFKYQTIVRKADHVFKGGSLIRRTLMPESVTAIWTRFFLETLMELLISCIIAFRMWRIRTYWNSWDKFAVFAHFLAIALTTKFIVFVFWFVFKKVKPYISYQRSKFLFHHSTTLLMK